MASRKEYTYQIKGNKLSLLEKDYTTSDGLNYTYNDGDGLGLSSGNTILKSPVSAVTDGIEIEYAYSPTYTISNTTGITPVFGWGFRYDGRLTLFDTNEFSALTVGSSVYFNGTRWAGIQEIAVEIYSYPNGATRSITFTAEANVSEQPPNKATQITRAVDLVALAGDTYAYVIGDSASDKNDIEEFKDLILDEEYYIHIGGMATDGNNGIFKVKSSSTHGQIDIISKATKAENQYTFGSFAGTAVDGDTNVKISYVNYAPGFQINASVDTLNDESDTISLTPYLSKALVYYVKAKVAEDQMNIEVKEYMMREFRKMVEKHENSKVAGPRRVMPGNNAIR